MEYRNLGRWGVKVSPLCLGAMMFGGETKDDEAYRIMDRAVEAEINFIDTSNSYNDGRSEDVIGRWLEERKLRDQIVLATKVYSRRGDGPNERGSSRYHIMHEVEGSLRRLRTDRLDIYQLHRPDKATPIEETMRALDDLVRAGKVLYIGTSVFSASRLAQMLALAERYGWPPVASEQPPYSILNRDVERESLSFCLENGIGVIPFSPLSGGWLAGKYRAGEDAPAGSRWGRRKIDMKAETTVRKLSAVEKIRELATAKGVELIPFAIAWLMSRPGVTAPIVGPKSLAHLEDYLKALDVSVTAEDGEKIDEIVKPKTKA